MKILKVKRTANSSFVTNRDLIQCLQNHSFVASKENSTRLHSNQSKISLLQKKNYDRMLTQENKPLIANNSPDFTPAPEFTPAPADRAIVLLHDCIASIGDTNQKLAHKLRKAIAYVRESQEAELKKYQDLKDMEREGEKAVVRKLETSCQEKAILKMQNDELKAKLAKYRQKIVTLKKQRQSPLKQPADSLKGNLSLQELVIHQGQVIDKQSEQNKREGEELRRILQIQALKIEQMLGRQVKRKPFHSPSMLRF